jgi:hypothetical protein
VACIAQYIDRFISKKKQMTMNNLKDFKVPLESHMSLSENLGASTMGALRGHAMPDFPAVT